MTMAKSVSAAIGNHFFHHSLDLFTTLARSPLNEANQFIFLPIIKPRLAVAEPRKSLLQPSLGDIPKPFDFEYGHKLDICFPGVPPGYLRARQSIADNVPLREPHKIRGKPQCYAGKRPFSSGVETGFIAAGHAELHPAFVRTRTCATCILAEGEATAAFLDFFS